MSNIDQLFGKHLAIGRTIAEADKTIMPMQGMKLAKQAAADSHALLGGILAQIKDLDRRVTALEARKL